MKTVSDYGGYQKYSHTVTDETKAKRKIFARIEMGCYQDFKSKRKHCDYWGKQKRDKWKKKKGNSKG